MLAFLWLSVHYLLKEGGYFAGLRIRPNVYSLPLVMSFFHAIAFILLVTTEKGRNMVRTVQGKYICYWNAASFIANEILQVILHFYSNTDHAELQTAIMFLVEFFVGLHVFYHLGTSIMLIGSMKVLLVAPWIWFLIMIVRYINIFYLDDFYSAFVCRRSLSLRFWQC